jgi:hypothetical protein
MNLSTHPVALVNLSIAFQSPTLVYQPKTRFLVAVLTWSKLRLVPANAVKVMLSEGQLTLPNGREMRIWRRLIGTIVEAMMGTATCISRTHTMTDYCAQLFM